MLRGRLFPSPCLHFWTNRKISGEVMTPAVTPVTTPPGLVITHPRWFQDWDSCSGVSAFYLSLYLLVLFTCLQVTKNRFAARGNKMLQLPTHKKIPPNTWIHPVHPQIKASGAKPIVPRTGQVNFHGGQVNLHLPYVRKINCLTIESSIFLTKFVGNLKFSSRLQSLFTIIHYTSVVKIFQDRLPFQFLMQSYWKSLFIAI